MELARGVVKLLAEMPAQYFGQKSYTFDQVVRKDIRISIKLENTRPRRLRGLVDCRLIDLAGGKETRVSVNWISAIEKIVGRNRVRQSQVGFNPIPKCNTWT